MTGVPDLRETAKDRKETSMRGGGTRNSVVVTGFSRQTREEIKRAKPGKRATPRQHHALCGDEVGTGFNNSLGEMFIAFLFGGDATQVG